jgi:hypothetical protein
MSFPLERVCSGRESILSESPLMSSERERIDSGGATVYLTAVKTSTPSATT